MSTIPVSCDYGTKALTVDIYPKGVERCRIDATLCVSARHGLTIHVCSAHLAHTVNLMLQYDPGLIIVEGVD